MPTFDIAYLRREGQDMIIVPLTSNFGLKTPQQKRVAQGSAAAVRISRWLGGRGSARLG